MANIYKKFRTVERIANKFTLSKRFDEPTYFSFRLIFGGDGDGVYNYADTRALYDTMPHPLFNRAIETQISNYATNTAVISNEQNTYSAINYLINANEPTRAKMLQEFIFKFDSLQNEFPYYFQSIDGISELLKIDPVKGQRITDDKKISITCLEGLDLRMSYLLNLYRKIAWDDVYQRWVLPDMMRYFTLKIYLAEFRTFHLPQSSPTQGNTGYGGVPAIGTVTDAAGNPQIAVNYAEPMPTSIKKTPLYLAILDDVLPTWEITCEMCEFDITDISFEHLNSLSVASDPNQGAVKFGIKVGNIKELQTYPVFEHMFLSDRKLNGINRSKEEISTVIDVNNKYLYPTSLQLAQSRERNVTETGVSEQHISGLPFNEMKNSDTMYGQGGPGADRMWGSKDDDTVSIDPTQPETWVGNAVKFGTSYAKGFVNKFVDKGKITQIPGLGVSFNEVKTAIESKNIVAAFGMIRKGINEVVKSYGNAPSSRLEQPIQTDMIMRQFLTEIKAIPKSEATDAPTIALIEAANIVLSEKGVWEKIKDYSLATNMVASKNEVNIPNNISNPNALKEQMMNATVKTETVLQNFTIYEGSPSRATTSNLQ